MTRTTHSNQSVRPDYAAPTNSVTDCERAYAIADAIGAAIGIAIFSCAVIAMLRWLS